MRDLRRVVIVGATGSGKSLLAERLATRLGADYVDALFWEPGWTRAAPEAFRTRVDRETPGPAWVIAGNYGRGRDLVWSRTECVVWLDYSFPRVLGRLVNRTTRSAATRETL